MPIFYFLGDNNSPVPVSVVKTGREGSLLMIGGEPNSADQVRDMRFI